MRRFVKVITAILVVISVLGIVSAQRYSYPKTHELQQRINYLSRIIKKPLNRESEIIKIGYQNPEWMLFSLSFTTYALTNISYLDSSFREQAVETIDCAIRKTLTDTIYRPFFREDNPFANNAIDSMGSVLYFGHLNLMLGCYRLLSENEKYNDLNDSLSVSLFKRYYNSGCLTLQSYPGMIWIPDNTVALASLYLHSMNTGSQYSKLTKDWVNYAKRHFLVSKNKLLCSTIDVIDCEAHEAPRGSMIGWSIFFIYRFDKEFAESQYEGYKENFSSNLLVTRLYKERYKNRTTGTGDIDSGPLLFGYSIPANAFAFACAVALNDLRNAKRSQRLISLGSKKNYENYEITIQTRFVDLNFSPLAEALLLYFETMTEWK